MPRLNNEQQEALFRPVSGYKHIRSAREHVNAALCVAFDDTTRIRLREVLQIFNSIEPCDFISEVRNDDEL